MKIVISKIIPFKHKQHFMLNSVYAALYHSNDVNLVRLQIALELIWLKLICTNEILINYCLVIDII